MRNNFRSREILVIDDPERGAALLEEKTLRFLAPFVGCERGAIEVAQELGVSLTTLLYQIKRLVNLDLLEATGRKPRRGSSVTLYRALSDAFFVPFRATPFERPEELLLRDYDPLHRQLLAGFLEAAIEMLGAGSVDAFGLIVSPRDGALEVRHGPAPGVGLKVNPLADQAPAMLNRWAELRLSFDEAKSLQCDLDALIERYGGGSGGSYLVHVGIAPIRSG
jgi:hypothetical protein